RPNPAPVFPAQALTGRRLKPSPPAQRLQSFASSDVYPWPAMRIVFSLPQHFARDRRRVALPERQELQQIRDGVALGPPEVHVRNPSRAIADVEQQRGNRVGNRRALTRQDAVRSDAFALDLE